MPDSPLIAATKLGMAFPSGDVALKGVDVGVERGEFVSIVGPSGCGKSTLLKLIAGLLKPTSGGLHVGGGAAGAADVAFVFQDPTLLPWRTAFDNVGLPLELRRVISAKRQRLIHDSLSLVGLTQADAAKLPRMLSGGMRMRVSIARALVTEPDILLLDEPFGALDDLLRQRLNEELLTIWNDKRWTTLFVTHNVSEAVFLSQRILVLSPAPGRVCGEVVVPFGFPREPVLRASAQFAGVIGEVMEMLAGESTPAKREAGPS